MEHRSSAHIAHRIYEQESRERLEALQEGVIDQIAASIDLRPVHRILTPDRDTWRDAGMLVGLLTRLQGYGKNERRKALNDALIFITAAKNGCVVLTRNLSEFDLLMQLDARGQAIFYDANGGSVRRRSVEL